MGPLGVHVDSTATQALIESAPSNAEIFLASGYFNLTQNYMDVILDESKADFQILMASPKVNGFYGNLLCFGRKEKRSALIFYPSATLFHLLTDYDSGGMGLCLTKRGTARKKSF